MRLLIISFMPHHVRDGEIVGWGPTVRELDQLATRFDSVRHIAPLYDEPAPASELRYSAKNIELLPVRPSGGAGFHGKVDALRAAPKYIRAMLKELPAADMVHVRAPASIALMAMVVLSAKRHPKPRWFKYAGNWRPHGRETPSYTFQRWWLGHSFHRGIVTVNGEWPDQPSWIRTFYNPSLTEKDIERGARLAATKRLGSELRLLYIGRIEVPKGAGRAIEILAKLRERGVDATLELVGDGPERESFERRAVEGGLAEHARFLGSLPHTALHEVYARSHLSLLPTSASEGWPKVLSEGMAYGVVPIAGAVSSIPQYLEKLRIGAAINADDLDAYVSVIQDYVQDPERWATEAKRSAEAADRFTFRYYLSCIDRMLADLGLPAGPRGQSSVSI
ncbi:MAG: glycosyltransferase [Deltaproteobacteria bacterium]|nr:glycosyltransferase [Deltaproteobacteria bacterium]